MRNLTLLIALALLSACQTPQANLAGPAASATPSPAQAAIAPSGYKPALDTRTWRGDVAAPKTQMAVLGSDHLAQVDGFDAANLSALLDRLAAFNPTIITQEGVSGEQCETLRHNPAIYSAEAVDYCSGVDEAKAATGFDVPSARAQAEKMLADWPATPKPADRRRLAALFLASGDRPSAQVQWLQLAPDERRIGDSVDAALLKILTRAGELPNERMQIGAALAARLGLQRIHPVDDQTALAVWARGGEDMNAAIQEHWSTDKSDRYPVLAEFGRARQNLATPDDVLAYYRLLNSAAIQMTFVESDFRDALELPGPDYFGQQYYAFNDLRNWRMVANIIEVSANEPGARVLNIVGASHKPYYEAYLDMVPYVELVNMHDVLK
jgi:Family of unknown function (DUF5694)